MRTFETLIGGSPDGFDSFFCGRALAAATSQIIGVNSTNRRGAKSMLRPDDDSREFTGYGRYIIAGFGAVSSLVAPLIIVDIEIIASSLQVAFASDFSGVWLIIGYFIRFSALVGAGVFWVWAFNRGEYNAWKLFQLGVVAPAILSGAAQSAKRDDLLDAAQQVQQSSYLFFLLLLPKNQILAHRNHHQATTCRGGN